MATKEPTYQEAIATLRAKCAAEGVASAQMTDGQIFMFSLETVRDLLLAAQKDPYGQVTVFVHKGKIFTTEDVQ